MLTFSVTLNLVALYIVVFDILAILVYVLYRYRKHRKLAAAVSKISEFIRNYFSDAGIDVRLSCRETERRGAYVVCIETEPLKRFRHSSVLENDLIRHVYKATGLEVERIFWRFPRSVLSEVTQISAQTEHEDLSLQPQASAPGIHVAEVTL